VSTLLLSGLLAGCAVIPQPVPQVAAEQPAPQVAAPPPAPVDWRDAPLTPGRWSYVAAGEASEARFGEPDAPVFVMRCDRAARRILLIRTGMITGTLSIRTSYALRSWPITTGGAVTLSASDRALDELAFTRGRFSVEMAGQATLAIPAWAEPSRLIEDCRI
jgi:hypothetical protein